MTNNLRIQDLTAVKDARASFYGKAKEEKMRNRLQDRILTLKELDNLDELQKDFERLQKDFERLQKEINKLLQYRKEKNKEEKNEKNDL